VFAVCLDVDDVLRFGQPCESIKQIAIVQHENQKQVFILFLPVLSRSHFFGVEGRDGAAAAVHARHNVRTCGIDLGDIKFIYRRRVPKLFFHWNYRSINAL
jgi:hypothetical protein